MGIDPWGNEIEDGSSGYSGIFAIRKSLDGEKTTDFVDKKRFIGVRISAEEFLIAVDHVSEIIMLPTITFVPNAARYIEGVMNLRGTILPVLNIRKMMGLQKGGSTPSTRVLICKDDHLNLRIGLVVDGISRVIAINPGEIDQSAPLSLASGHDILAGVSKQAAQVCGVISLPKILSIAADGKSLTNPEGESEIEQGHDSAA